MACLKTQARAVKQYNPTNHHQKASGVNPHRGQGLGQVLMHHILAQAKASAATHAVLNAQLAVKDFYAGLGFVAEGPEFMEADIPHVHMRLKLT